MKKIFALILTTTLTFSSAFSSVPTEEGLLKNLSNNAINGNSISLKFIIQPLDNSGRLEYARMIFSIESPTVMSLLQVVYSNSQMLNSQIKSYRYIPNLVVELRREKSSERNLFYGTLLMLAANDFRGMEVFLNKNGVDLVKNADVVNEDKMNLLQTYKNYLVQSKGRGEQGSPLNPEDPKNKEKVIELFKSNTFKRAKNIELVRRDNEFMWKIDWKSTQGFFSNEEKHFRSFEYSTIDSQIKVEANQYLLFNGVNIMPKYLNLKDHAGNLYRLQTVAHEVKKETKKLVQVYEEFKKLNLPSEPSYSFLY